MISVKPMGLSILVLHCLLIMRTPTTVCRPHVVDRSIASYKKAHYLMPSYSARCTVHCLTSTSFLVKFSSFLQRSAGKIFLLMNIEPSETTCVFSCFIASQICEDVLIWVHCTVMTINNCIWTTPSCVHMRTLCSTLLFVYVHFDSDILTQRMERMQDFWHKFFSIQN